METIWHSQARCQRPISNCQHDNYWHRRVQAGKGFQGNHVNNFLLCFKLKISRRWVTGILMESIPTDPLSLGTALASNGASGHSREIQSRWEVGAELDVHAGQVQNSIHLPSPGIRDSTSQGSPRSIPWAFTLWCHGTTPCCSPTMAALH